MIELFEMAFVFQIVQAAIVLVGAFVLVAIFNKLLLKMAGGKTSESKRMVHNAQRFIQITIFSAAAILLLHIFNVDVTGLLAGLGVGTLVISFALKDIIENWISGLLIISGKTYKLGDIIQVGDRKGIVTEISLRTTKLKTYDRKEIIIPNSSLLKDRIINLTDGKKEAITSVVFTVDYAFNIEKVKKIIENVLRSHPNVVVDKERQREIRFLVRTKEWSVEIEPLFWINDPENEEFIKSQITEATKMKLEEAQIFPTLPESIRESLLKNKN
ncbi:MAG: mechanosensitive ion channel family protein [Candidatus Bathyarchaeia archaeon]